MDNKMERITLYKVTKEEVSICGRDRMEFHYHGNPDALVGNTGDFIYGLVDTETVDVEEVRNQNSRFLYAVDPKLKDLLLRIREPEKFDRLADKIKNLTIQRDSINTRFVQQENQSKYLNNQISNIEKAGFLLRLKWLFTSVKSSDVLFKEKENA